MKVVSDRFGSINLEEQCLYGVQTARTVENMGCSRFRMSDYPGFVKALALVKKSCAFANLAAGLIRESQCRAISAACDRIISGEFLDQFPVDMLHGGGSIGFNQNMNEVLASLVRANSEECEKHDFKDNHIFDAGTSLEKLINASQSTADVCATAFRLALIEACDDLILVLEKNLAQIELLSTDYAGFETVARTCLQDAMPVEVGSYFQSWAEAFKRTLRRIRKSREDLHSVNLGGTVIGSGDGATDEYRDRVLPALSDFSNRKLDRKSKLYDAAQNIDEIVELSAALELFSGLLLKICKDLRLLASGPLNGFAEMILPAVQDGSSFFAKKNNPVLPEMLMNVCFHVKGNHLASQSALEHAELNLNVFESAAFFHTMDSLELLSASLELFRAKCLCGLKVNEARCAELIENLKRQS